MLEKHDCHEYLDLYKKMGIVFVVNGYRKPKMKNKLRKKGKLTPLFKSYFFQSNQKPYNKSNPLQQTFLEDLVLYVTKVY